MEEKEILKINWFAWDIELKWWLRSDWYLINKKDLEYIVSDWWFNLEKYCKNNEELIWYLAIKWIINRLF